MLPAGTIIAGKYELARLLGSGSMGDVWLAHHLSLGEDVALKVIGEAPPEGIDNPEAAAARFQFEAQVAARLSRKTRHIVRVTDHGDEDGMAYLVMELLEGENLQTRLLRGALPLAEIVTLVAQVSRALTEAHSAGVIHRDLKPANVFLARDEDGGMLVKLLDFGIARAMRTHKTSKPFETGRGFVFGTPCYMSPEQARPVAPVDHRCDLWALATVAYEALTTDIPVGGANVEELFDNLWAGRLIPFHARSPEMPPGLRAFFERAFARNPADRFDSATELSQAFERAAAPSLASPQPPPTSEPPDTREEVHQPLTFPTVLPSARSMPVPRSRRLRFVTAAAGTALLGVVAIGTTLLARAHANQGSAMVVPAMGASQPPAPTVDAPMGPSAGSPPVIALEPIAAASEPPRPFMAEASAPLAVAPRVPKTAPARPPVTAVERAPAVPFDWLPVADPASPRAQARDAGPPSAAKPPPPHKPVDKSDVF